jgi:hypothetical protein
VRQVLVAFALLACCQLASAMRLHAVPEYADLAGDEVVELDGRRCVAARGSVVEVLGTTTSLPESRTDILLVRVVSGPCAGGRVSVEAKVLLDLRPTPGKARGDRR